MCCYGPLDQGVLVWLLLQPFSVHVYLFEFVLTQKNALFFCNMCVVWLVPQQFPGLKQDAKLQNHNDASDAVKHTQREVMCLVMHTWPPPFRDCTCNLVVEPGLAILRFTIPAANTNNKRQNKLTDRQPKPSCKPCTKQEKKKQTKNGQKHGKTDKKPPKNNNNST